MTTKTCLKCKVAKSIDCFTRNKREQDGFQSTCRSCQAAYHREYRSTLGARL